MSFQETVNIGLVRDRTKDYLRLWHNPRADELRAQIDTRACLCTTSARWASPWRHRRERPCVLGIDGNGDYYLNKAKVPGCTSGERQAPDGKAACATQLLPRMQRDYSRAGHEPNDHVLFLTADQGRPCQDVLDLMSLARHAGVAMVALVSEQPPGVKAELEKAQHSAHARATAPQRRWAVCDV